MKDQGRAGWTWDRGESVGQRTKTELVEWTTKVELVGQRTKVE